MRALELRAMLDMACAKTDFKERDTFDILFMRSSNNIVYRLTNKMN